MKHSHKFTDTTKCVRDFDVAAERGELNAIRIHSSILKHGLLLQSDRCRRMELVLNALVANAAAGSARPAEKIEVELMQEAEFVHCAVSSNAFDRPVGVHSLELAHELAKPHGRIGCWFDDATSSLVLTIPPTECEKQANRLLLAS